MFNDDHSPPQFIRYLRWSSRTGQLTTPCCYLIVSHRPFGFSSTLEAGVRIPLPIYLSMSEVIYQESERLIEEIRAGEETSLIGLNHLDELKEMMGEVENLLLPSPRSYVEYPVWGRNERYDRLVWRLTIQINALVGTGILQEDEENGVRVILDPWPPS
jgi:hypothetical protein